ncbi:MAG: histidine kinase dimerization/phospho-acceptor domain-containing protein, partial [Nitrososphaerota archaeon]
MELYLLAILGVLTLVFLTFIVTWFFQQRAQGEIVRKTLLDFNKSLEALWGVEEKILSSLNFEEIVDKIANIVLTELNYLELGYVVVVLALIDKEKNVLRRISLSSTPEAQAFLKEFKVHFRDIVIPLSEEENLGIKAIKERRVFIAHDVSDLLYPAMKREHVRDLQKRVGIKTSVVFPVFSRGKVIGHIIFSMKKNDKDISPMEWSVLRSFTSAVGISVENAQLFDEVRKTSEKLRIANEKLKELDKLKDEFVSIASHELRTPMTAIKSYLWMVLAGKAGPLSEKMQKYLERAYVSVDRLIDLVNNMLNVSRIESGRIELEKRAINLSELVEDVIDEVDAKERVNGLTISVQLVKNLPLVLADWNKIREVLTNLVGNALKFTPAGGKII